MACCVRRKAARRRSILVSMERRAAPLVAPQVPETAARLGGARRFSLQPFRRLARDPLGESGQSDNPTRNFGIAMKPEIPDQAGEPEMPNGGMEALEKLRGSLSPEHLNALASFFESINNDPREAGIGARFPVSVAARAPKKLTAENFRLWASASNGVIADLDAVLPKVSVAAVVASANRKARSCRPHPKAVAAFCWQQDDGSTTEWYPQGITTSADANADGQDEDKAVVLTSWYHRGGNKGVRVSFVDYSNRTAPRYRHVLLVEPYKDAAGNANFRAVRAHAGGILWYGHYLYDPDTLKGLRVIDTQDVWEVSMAGKDNLGRQPDGSYHAHAYAYALPQAMTFAPSTTGGYAPLRYSAISLDRTTSPHSVIVPEYDSGGTGTRVVRYPIDESTLMLKPSEDGYVHASEAYRVDIRSMQGATAVGGKFYVSSSRGARTRGSIYTFTGNGGPTAHPHTLPPGPEDLSYWRSRDELWTLGEHPGKRSVLAVKASSF
jgi:hypothetical protein